jgi:hypothetical protein
MEKVLSPVAAALGAVAILVLIGGIFSYFVMLLWNGCLVPAINGVNPITWLQAWGISILFGWLFKSSNYRSSK